MRWYDFDPDSIDPVLSSEHRKLAGSEFPSGMLGFAIMAIAALTTIAPVIWATIWVVGVFGW